MNIILKRRTGRGGHVIYDNVWLCRKALEEFRQSMQAGNLTRVICAY